jgi:hypothetical protein
MLRAEARRVLRVASVIALIAGLAGAVAAQSSRPAATLDDLLAETRALRLDMNRMTTAAIRAQVLATRLSAQEQRIRTLADQVGEAQQAIASAASERRARSTHLEQLHAVRRAGNLVSAQSGEGDEMLTRLGQEVGQWTADEQALREVEQQLRRALTAEQNLWGDFNSRLEELERSLPAADRR